MSKLVFRPEQFANLEIMKDEVVPRNAAEIAQDIYDQYLASCPIVQASCSETGYWSAFTKDENATHTARLVNVEKLECKPCQHEPIMSWRDGLCGYVPECKHCKCELVAEWKAK